MNEKKEPQTNEFFFIPSPSSLIPALGGECRLGVHGECAHAQKGFESLLARFLLRGRELLPLLVAINYLVWACLCSHAHIIEFHQGECREDYMHQPSDRPSWLIRVGKTRRFKRPRACLLTLVTLPCSLEFSIDGRME
jgi:hypothetical protein